MGFGERLKDYIWLRCDHVESLPYGTTCFLCACLVQSQMEKEANDDFAKLVKTITNSVND